MSTILHGAFAAAYPDREAEAARFDPPATPPECPHDMAQQIAEAYEKLAMAERALSGLGREVSTLAARSLMNEAAEWLARA